MQASHNTTHDLTSQKTDANAQNTRRKQILRQIRIWMGGCGLLVFGVFFAQARPLHYDYLHTPWPQKAESKQEQALLQRLSLWYNAQPFDLPQSDNGLREAAALLASYLARAPSRRLSHERVQAALSLSGRSDLQLQIFAMAFTQESLLWKQLQDALAQRLAEQRFNRMGLAIRSKQQRICVILFVRRAFEIAPSPRWSAFGQALHLRATVLKPFQLDSVVIGHPDARTQTLTAQYIGNLLSFQWNPPRDGRFQIQFIARDHRGPWISAQWAVDIYKPPHTPETLWRTHWQQQLHALWGASSAPKHRPVLLNSTAAAHRLWELLNAVRSHRELVLFRRHHRLDRFAYEHAEEMVKQGFFGHNSPKKGSFAQRFKELGWPARNARENIVVARTPEEALRLWVESPVHRRNLLHPDLLWTGIAAYPSSSGRFYFVQVFVSAL